MLTTIVLMPGDLYFGQQKVKIKTLLGSCVAIVVWHPQKQLGGMCHFVLPSRHGRTQLDARYADEAMELFANEMAKHNTRPNEYQTWLFGGANMFSVLSKECLNHSVIQTRRCPGCNSVACRNRIAALELIQQYGMVLMESDLGGQQHRQVEFHLGKGKPYLKHNCVNTKLPPALAPLWTQRL